MIRLSRRAWLAAAGSLTMTTRWGAAFAAVPDQPMLPPAHQRLLEVHDGDGLERALSDAKPGDHLLLAPGRYDGTFVLSQSGAADRPIVVRAAMPGTAELLTSLVLRGNHAWAFGLVSHAAPGIDIDGGADHHVTGCRFTRCTGVLLRDGASRNQIGWNSFVDMTAPNEVANGVRLDLRRREIGKRTAFGNHIYRNYFATRPLEARSDAPAVYIGLMRIFDYPEVGSLVEHNYFDRLDFKSAIRLKSNGNLVRFNTVVGPGAGTGRDDVAMYSQRHGHFNRWEANWAENSRGFKAHGNDNVFAGNRISGRSAYFDLLAGSTRAKQEACNSTLWIGNEGPMRVGYEDYPFEPDQLATSNRIEGQRPSRDVIQVFDDFQTGTTILDTATRTVELARPLSRGDAGAEAVAG